MSRRDVVKPRKMQAGTVLPPLQGAADARHGFGGSLSAVSGFKRRIADEEERLDCDINSDNYRSSKRYLSQALAKQLESLKLKEVTPESDAQGDVRGKLSAAQSAIGETGTKSIDNLALEEDATGDGIEVIDRTRDVAMDSGSPPPTSRSIVVYQPHKFNIDSRILDAMGAGLSTESWMWQCSDNSMAIVPYRRPQTLKDLHSVQSAHIAEEDGNDPEHSDTMLM